LRQTTAPNRSEARLAGKSRADEFRIESFTMIPLHRAGLLLGAGWLLTQGLAAVPAFPIKASANGRYLVDTAGIPLE